MVHANNTLSCRATSPPTYQDTEATRLLGLGSWSLWMPPTGSAGFAAKTQSNGSSVLARVDCNQNTPELEPLSGLAPADFLIHNLAAARLIGQVLFARVVEPLGPSPQWESLVPVPVIPAAMWITNVSDVERIVVGGEQRVFVGRVDDVQTPLP